jgi:hypothetical protein
MAEPVEVKPPQQKTLSSAGGRFVFGQISDYGSDQYMLDTATGRLWQKVCAKDNDNSIKDACTLVLQTVPYVGADDKFLSSISANAWSTRPK